MENKISVVIRTYNEQKHIGKVLDSLKRQIYGDFEIIIVDSGSTDATLEIVKSYNVKIVRIEKKDFNYSYASNIGVQNTSGDIVCFLSGHSVPVKTTYLSDVNDVFQSENIGACYGDVIALPDGSITEKIFNFLGYIKNKRSKRAVQLESKIHPGIMSCSNASIRKNLLLIYPFQEALGRGGEDVEVAYRIIEEGHFVAKVPELLVMHSHGSGFLKFIKEFMNWRVMYNEVTAFINSSKK